MDYIREAVSSEHAHTGSCPAGEGHVDCCMVILSMSAVPRRTKVIPPVRVPLGWFGRAIL